MVEQAFEGRFVVVSTHEATAMYDGRSIDDGDLGVLRQALIGWREMIDDNNATVPFSEEKRDQLLAVPFVRRAIADTYARAMNGAPARA